MRKDTEEKINKLQLLEQKVQSLLMQKQTFQSQLLEIENALTELSKSKGESYKIIGNVMLSMKKEEIEKDLKNKKELVDIRIKNLDKQEEKIKEEVNLLQKEIVKESKNGK